MPAQFLDIPVGQLVLERPSRAAVFERFGIDYCCGGKLALARACSFKHVNPDDVVAALDAADAPTQEAEVDWTSVPLHELVRQIVTVYHDGLRAAMPRLEALAEKVARVHGDHHPYLLELAGVLHRFGADMAQHMSKEEHMLFPLITSLEAGTGGPHGAMVGMPIRVMNEEHLSSGDDLVKMHALTSGFVPPEDACNSFRALYHGLAELEAETHMHIHLEENVLFPRALELAAAQQSGGAIQTTKV